ncbi:MAG: hypothetical protein ABFS42_04315, partial [Candidatus Krumholzibacteriota bacterium]
MFYRITAPILLVLFLTAGAAAQLPNLTYKYDATRMIYPLTPTTANPTSVPATVSATLPGNSDTIYWNMIGQNNGTGATPDIHSGAFALDGVGFGNYWTLSSTPPGGAFIAWDAGPMSARGGRHTLEVIHDDENLVLESDETDNWWAHQFVFTPFVLSPSIPTWRQTPPSPFGGTFSIIDGSPIGLNCDGFRFTTTGWWNAIVLNGDDPANDYDLHLFAPSTGSEDGFLTPIVNSGFLAGKLDAIIVNRNTVGVTDYDVGVTHYEGDQGFEIRQVISEPAWVGMNTTVSFAANECLKIWDTYSEAIGYVTVSATDSLNTGIEFAMGMFHTSTTEIGLSDLSLVWFFSDENGDIRLSREITMTGYYGLVIYRNPDEGMGPVDLTLSIEPMPPDLFPDRPPHYWHSELVPTPDPPPSGSLVVLPDTLHGYVPETYLSFGAHNYSFTPSPVADLAVYQDGMDYWYYPYLLPALPGPGLYKHYGLIGREIPGGRHALTMELDHTEVIHEIYESNNVYTEQYCWSPLELAPGQVYSHHYPGPVIGGYPSLGSGEPWFGNCDGYRIQTGAHQWEGMVLTQGPGSDYDLDFHNPLVGVKDGFNDYLGSSWSSAGETDYLLVNNRVLAPGVYDVGVTNLLGSEEYTVEAVGSTTLPQPTHGRYGPYSMFASNMLHIYDIYLVPDVYAFRVDNLGPAVDWGMDLHDYASGLMGRQDAMFGASSYMAGPGQGEFFTISIATAGWYGLTVFKATPDDFDLDGQYQLTILMGISDVDEPENVPVATVLNGAHP